jgi:hypothetical protein
MVRQRVPGDADLRMLERPLAQLTVAHRQQSEGAFDGIL